MMLVGHIFGQVLDHMIIGLVTTALHSLLLTNLSFVIIIQAFLTQKTIAAVIMAMVASGGLL